MATVRMKKNGMFADVFDSEETIKNAQLDGWSVCDEKSPDTIVEKAIEDELKPQVEAELNKGEAKTTHKRASSKK